MALITDYEGTQYDWPTIQNLMGKILPNLDPNRLSGGAFGTGGQSIGFNFDEASRYLGRAPTTREQIALDMARQLAKSNVLDISQLSLGQYTPPPLELESGFREDGPRSAVFANGNLLGSSIIPGSNFFGATYTGPGGTSYNVSIDPATGKPVFYTEKIDTSDKDALKALAVFGALAGGASLLGGLGGGTAAGAGAAGAGATGAGAAGAGLTAAEIAALADVGMGLNTSALAGSTALGSGAFLGEGIASNIPQWDIAFGDALLSNGYGLSPSVLTGPEALSGIDAMIAAGEGIVPITAEQVATTGLTAAESAALGSGIGLSGGTGLLSGASNYLKDPKNLANLAKLGINLASLGGAANMFGAGNAEVGSIPTQGMPVNTPEYYQAVQGFLNQYLPGQMPNQAGYLADWYGGTGTFGGTGVVGGVRPPVPLRPSVPPRPPVKMIPGLDAGQSARYAQLSPEDQKKYLALAGAYNAPGDAASDAALVREVMRSSGLDINAVAELAGVDPQMVTSYLGQEGLTPAQLAQYQSLGYGGQNIYKNLVGAYQSSGTVQEDAQQVLQVMQENKLTPADLAIITGIPVGEINAYLAQATPTSTPASSGGGMMSGGAGVDYSDYISFAPEATVESMGYTRNPADIANAYREAIAAGMNELQFIQAARDLGYTDAELLAAQNSLLGK